MADVVDVDTSKPASTSSVPEGPIPYPTAANTGGDAAAGVQTSSISLTQYLQQVLAQVGKLTGKPISTGGNNLTSLQIWAQNEGGGFKNSAYNNVLNTTEPGYGQFMSQGLPAYPTANQGIQATAATIVQYPSILKNLESNAAPSQTLTAVQESPWAQSHYGYKLNTETLSPSTESIVLDQFTGKTAPAAGTTPGSTIALDIGNANGSGGGTPNVSTATITKVLQPPLPGASSGPAGGGFLYELNTLLNPAPSSGGGGLVNLGPIENDLSQTFFRAMFAIPGFIMLLFGFVLIGLPLLRGLTGPAAPLVNKVSGR